MMIETALQLQNMVKEIKENNLLTTKEKDRFIGMYKKQLYRTNPKEYSLYDRTK